MRQSRNNLTNNIIHLHDQDWIDRQRHAGKCVATVMMMLEDLVHNKTELSLLELDALAEKEIRKFDCDPTFLGYSGFPNSVCISVNEELVHGVPTDRRLKEGDVITFDFGATYKGAIVDSAMSMIYGTGKQEHQTLIQATKECLYNSIRYLRLGERVGCIGHNIYKTARDNGFNVIEQYGGHGISEAKVHANPFIANRASREEGPRLYAGQSIAIEPLLVPKHCSTRTRVKDDKWTVLTEDISAHTEHSLYLHPEYIEIMSHRENEKIDRKIEYKG